MSSWRKIQSGEDHKSCTDRVELSEALMNTVEDLDINPKIKTSLKKGLAIIFKFNSIKLSYRPSFLYNLTINL